VLEVVASSRGLGLLGSRCPAGALPALAIGIATSASRCAEHDQLTHVDLRAVPGLSVLVLPLWILDAALDVDLVALLHVTLDDISELRRLRVPDHASVPLGLLLFRASRIVPRAACCERERRDTISSGCRSNLRIVSEISNQHHLIQATAHVFLLARGSQVSPHTVSSNLPKSLTVFAHLVLILGDSAQAALPQSVPNHTSECG